MSAADPTGTDWTDQEIDLIVADYFDMLRLEIAAQPYVKSQRNESLQQLTHRSRGSIEFKHQNISAVLDLLGLPWIRGYLPRANFQRALLEGIERFLDRGPDILTANAPTPAPEFSESPALFFEAPPNIAEQAMPASPTLRRIVRKFDPADRDAQNRTLGIHGEELVFHSERSMLTAAGRGDLSRKVRWVSREDGDGAGYDIRSFDQSGNERLLEVKTTNGGQRTPFFLSENERSVSVERAQVFRLVRLYEFAAAPKAFVLMPPLEDSVLLRPANYRASFNA